MLGLSGSRDEGMWLVLDTCSLAIQEIHGTSFIFPLSLACFYTGVRISFKTSQLLAPADALPSISPVQVRAALAKMQIIVP